MLIFSLLFLGAAAMSAGVPYLTEPALCPTRPEIAFVSGGDIWLAPAKGGEAHLLVSHPADESRPLYSPDGMRLAFMSTRTGNGDIYVLTLATGELKRLTFDDGPEQLDAWSRDGRWIYFSSGSQDVGRKNDIFRVSVEGAVMATSNGGATATAIWTNRQRSSKPPYRELASYVYVLFAFRQFSRQGGNHLENEVPFPLVVEEFNLVQ